MMHTLRKTGEREQNSHGKERKRNEQKRGRVIAPRAPLRRSGNKKAWNHQHLTDKQQ
jgi:hypothetical protein